MPDRFSIKESDMSDISTKAFVIDYAEFGSVLVTVYIRSDEVFITMIKGENENNKCTFDLSNVEGRSLDDAPEHIRKQILNMLD